MSRIPELDGLRAWAILAVFCVHFRPLGYRISDVLALGWSGVDLFFAISGFLITGILLSLRNHDRPYRTFYGRRALRIFPPYYLAWIVILLLTFLHGETMSGKEQFGAWFLLSSLGHGFSLPLMWSRLLHGGFHVAAIPLFHNSFTEFRYGKGGFWSLSVEELFYLLWAPVVLKGSRRLILCFCVIPLFVCPVLRGLNHSAEFWEVESFPCRFDSLAAGGCVTLLFTAVRRGHLSQRLLDNGLRFAIAFASVGLFLLSWHCGVFRGVEIRSTTSFSVFGFSLLSVLCAASVGACARWSGTPWTRFLRFRPFLQVGTVSYMSYLTHILVFTSVGFVLTSLGIRLGSQLLQGLITVPCVLAVAAISWKYFESPILALKDRRFGSSASAVTETEGPPVEAAAVATERV